MSEEQKIAQAILNGSFHPRCERMAQMNEEKKIAQAIVDAHTAREESYYIPTGDGSGIGAYRLRFEECFKVACENNKLSSNLWGLLVIANYCFNDIQEWAEKILKG